MLFTLPFYSQESTDIKSLPLTDGSKIICETYDLSIVPPAGFRHLEGYCSFISEETGVSISAVKRDDISIDTYLQYLEKGELTNAKLIEKKELDNGWLFCFEFLLEDKPVERLMYITGNKEMVIYSMANYRKRDRFKFYSMLKKALVSVKY